MEATKTKYATGVARRVGDAFIARLADYCEGIEYGGSLRREKESVSDIEIVCRPLRVQKNTTLFDEQEVRHPGFAGVLAKYGKLMLKGRGNYATGKYFRINPNPKGSIKYPEIDLFVANPDNYGYILAIRTGSVSWNKHVLIPALKSKGYSLEAGYILKRGQMVPVPNEATLFTLAGLKYVQPKDRVWL